jgi:putative transcriptional regulator
MKDEMFKELVASVREGGTILRGETPPSCQFVREVPDVKTIRAQVHL